MTRRLLGALRSIIAEPSPDAAAHFHGDGPAVLPKHTVLVGIRNLDEREKAQIRSSGVHVFTMKDIDRAGIASVTEQALEAAELLLEQRRLVAERVRHLI